MAMAAAYDQIADWYEHTFLGERGGNTSLGVDDALRDLLGTVPPARAGDPCLTVGCGTGAHSDQVRRLGWSPVGVDLSTGMLRHARNRLPVARGDAERLPVRDASVAAAIAVMVHTDMPGYPAVLREVARVLAPGGLFVHVGVHPCFCGGFSDFTDPRAVVIRPGYRDSYWTKQSWTDQGLRDKVGAMHRPLPELLHAFLDAGLALERFAEGGAPIPTMFAARAREPG
jgi:ubiquinone/menaquinone biosynthesis C-methylase UbiE